MTMIISYLLIFVYLHTFSTMIRSDTLIAELGTVTIPAVKYKKTKNVECICGNDILILFINIK